MTETFYICWALMSMSGVINQHNICNNVTYIDNVTKEFKIDPKLYVAMLWEESNFTSDIKSSANACGISQVLPQYTDLYNKKARNKRKEKRRVCRELSKAKTGIYYGAKSFSYWFNIYSKKNIKVALCAYNAGFRCKNEKLKPSGLKARKRAYSVYVPRVYKFYKRLKKKVSVLKKIDLEVVKCINDYISYII